MVSVAQLVERWIVAPVVVGSIPITHPKSSERSDPSCLLNGSDSQSTGKVPSLDWSSKVFQGPNSNLRQTVYLLNSLIVP
jgi:hypothetical protein